MLLESLVSVLNEELHSEIQSILDSKDDLVHKHRLITAKIRSLNANGIDTGLEDGKPKKGSSRVVYFPKEYRELNLDGQTVKMPIAVKIAFPGVLDKYRKNGEPLLGELQNENEGSHFANQKYGVIYEDGENNYKTNKDGILAPVTKTHEKGHWLEMAKVDSLKESDFKRLTKTPEFPKGISHHEFIKALINEHYAARGKRAVYHVDEKIHNHPLVEQFKNYIFDTGSNPHDYDKRNMGIFKHPITGKEHIVLRDFGADDNVLNQYGVLRQRIGQSAFKVYL